MQTEAFCDVTIACDGASVKCHKMILSACSSYFQQLFMENTCDHPIVFLKVCCAEQGINWLDPNCLCVCGGKGQVLFDISVDNNNYS